MSTDDVFADQIKDTGEPGALLKGLRTREEKNQTEFAAMIGISQANLSAIENGRRTIGRILAQRIGKQFDIDYRLFL